MLLVIMDAIHLLLLYSTFEDYRKVTRGRGITPVYHFLFLLCTLFCYTLYRVACDNGGKQILDLNDRSYFLFDRDAQFADIQFSL